MSIFLHEMLKISRLGTCSGTFLPIFPLLLPSLRKGLKSSKLNMMNNEDVYNIRPFRPSAATRAAFYVFLIRSKQSLSFTLPYHKSIPSPFTTFQ